MRKSYLVLALLSLVLFSCNSDHSKTANGRVVASGMSLAGDYIERNNSELSNLINEILAIKTSEELYSFLVRVDKNYDQLKTEEAKYFALQMSMMIPLKGIYWRLDGLFASHVGDRRADLTDTTQNLYSALVSRVAVFNNIFAGFSDANHWRAGYDFLAVPNENFTFNEVATRSACEMKKSGSPRAPRNGGYVFGHEFKSERDYRAFLACEFYPALLAAEKRLEALLSTKKVKGMESSADFFAWDNKVVFGAASFDPDRGEDMDRIRKITGGDVYAVMATIESAKASTESIIAYRLKGLTSILNKAGWVIASPGINLTTKKRRGSWNAEKRSEIVAKRKQFLTAEMNNFYGGDYKYWMAKSLKSIEKWWTYADKSRQIYEDTDDFFDRTDAQVIFNPALVNFINRSLNLTNDTIKAMIFNNESVVQSTANGKKIRLRFRDIYLNPAKDLKVYMPTRFQKVGNKLRAFNSKRLGKRVEYNDFLIGSAVSWNAKEYQKLFPKVKNDEDLREAALLLSQSWGGLTGLTLLNQIFL